MPDHIRVTGCTKGHVVKNALKTRGKLVTCKTLYFTIVIQIQTVKTREILRPDQDPDNFANRRVRS